MRRPKKDIQLTSYDELLGLEETPEKSMNQVVEIDLAKLYPFKNHPFHVNDDEKMAETVESIKTYGVLTPALVRPRSEGGYEMISGHRRKRGCELCGKTTMPALVRNYTDDEAVIIMVDSNIQRENILPSEKAHAYKMKYDVLKRKSGRESLLFWEEICMKKVLSIIMCMSLFIMWTLPVSAAEVISKENIIEKEDVSATSGSNSFSRTLSKLWYLGSILSAGKRKTDEN